jgi:hypothetical protein
MQDLTGFVGGVGDRIKAKTLAVDLLDDAALSSDPVPAMALVGRATYLGNVFRGIRTNRGRSPTRLDCPEGRGEPHVYDEFMASVAYGHVSKGSTFSKVFLPIISTPRPTQRAGDCRFDVLPSTFSASLADSLQTLVGRCDRLGPAFRE